MLKDTDRKRFFTILIQHPFLQTAMKRRALLVNCGLEHLLFEIEKEESPRDFVHLLYAQVIQRLVTGQSREFRLVSLLTYLVDFSGPDDLSQEDREFLAFLLQEYRQKFTEKETGATGNIKNIESIAGEGKAYFPAIQTRREENRERENENVEQLYLKYVIKNLKWIEITGLPDGIIAQSAPLEEIFIPLQLRPNRPLTEYPLTERELNEYYHRLKHNLPLRDMERFVFEAERNWSTRERKPININNFWQNLVREQPTAVIQGYPGAGKSTLMKYLALYMARRGLRQHNREIPTPLTPTLIPFLVSLSDFANERVKKPDLSLMEYLRLKLNYLTIPGLSLLLEESLNTGRSLVLLDGLDEVSDHRVRIEIQTEIKEFILTYNDIFEETPLFNRFLVTTRVAGYDQAAFPMYQHYTIAELTPEQIDDFLPRWCRAIVRLDPAFVNVAQNDPERFEHEVQRRTEQLQTNIHERPDLQTLVENPLLLTLLALMQQNQVTVPDQRIDLYHIFVQTLLEKRSEVRGTPLIPEAQAILRLGPLALNMLETGNNFLHQNDVMASLINTIRLEEGTADPQQEAVVFLYKLRVRVGIFVLRAGDYYGFIHRTFQEYFVACYIVHSLTLAPDKVADFINNVCNRYDIWRESFLLAIAYASGRHEAIANMMMSNLLDMPSPIDEENRELRLQLAVESLLEAKPASIELALERRTAAQLLQLYELAQQSSELARCERIEGLVLRWLSSLSEQQHHSGLLAVLHAAISDTQRATCQRAALTLLARVATLTLINKLEKEQQRPWPMYVLATLVPLLLALTGLPAISEYQLAPEIIASSDIVAADLSLIVLSLLEIQGPAGLLPTVIRQHFKDHPEQLRILAQHSVASNALLTPVIISRTHESNRKWPGDILLEQWLSQRSGYHIGHIQQKYEELCLSIHQGLLECAEVMRYPLTLDIIRILARAQQHPEQPWQQVWQDYLIDQMNSGHYISYQENALLYSILFSKPEELKKMATLLLEHLQRDNSSVQCFAQRFLATLGDNLRVQEELQETGNQFLQYLRYLLDIGELLYIQDTQNLRYWRYLIDMHNLQNLREIQGRETLHNPQYIQDLQAFLFTPDTTRLCLTRLNTGAFKQDEYADLLTILLGRVLFIMETAMKGKAIEEELQQIIRAINLETALVESNTCSAIVLDILRYIRFIPVGLPVSTPEEICIVLQLAEKVPDQWVQDMCDTALQRITPEMLHAGKAMKASRQMEGKQQEELIAEQQQTTNATAHTLPSSSSEDMPPSNISPQKNYSAAPPSTREETLQTNKKAMGSNNPMCDVCVVCALSEEVEIFIREVSRLCNVTFQRTFGPTTKREYRYATIQNNQGEPLTIYVTWPPDYGPEEVALHFKPVLTELNPRFVAMTGICAGDKKKVLPGDIIIAESAFLYDTGKFVSGKRGRKKQLYDTNTYRPHSDILQFVRMFDSWKPAVGQLRRPDSKRQQRDWLLNTLLETPELCIDDISRQELEQHAPDWKEIVYKLQSGQHPLLTKDRTLYDPLLVRELVYGKEKFPFKDPTFPRHYFATIASGSAVRSDNPFDAIQAPVRGAIAVDMEGATFYRTVAEFPHIRSLLVKCVCDYADSDKDDSYHDYASAVSAIYVLFFIKDYVTHSLMPGSEPPVALDIARSLPGGYHERGQSNVTTSSRSTSAYSDHASDSIKLDRIQREQLHKALLSAFPSRSDLQQMVDFGLDTNLDTIVSYSNLAHSVFELINWADAHDKIGELIRASYKANNGNARLRAFISQPGILEIMDS
jgi:nucleoside phosphorylase